MDETPVTESPTAAAPSASETATPPVVSEVSTPEPVQTPEPVAAPEPAKTDATAPGATPPVESGKEPTSLLGDAVEPAPEPKAETKPEAEKPVGEEKPEGDAPAIEEAPAEPAPLPTYDVFTVPEGVELEDTQVDRYIEFAKQARSRNET